MFSYHRHARYDFRSCANCQLWCYLNYNNDAAAETYQKNFTVDLGPKVTFFDDFSTATRQKEFSASLERIDTKPYVRINYFSDVGVFTAIDVDASLLIRGGTAIQSTSGFQQFIDTRLTPQKHITDYTLSCNRVIEEETL